jgi:hypothetical protein
MFKRCNGPCKQEKDLSNYHKGNGSFGVKSRCKECCKVSYKQNSPEYRKIYYLKNIEKAREARRRHQERNREEYRLRSREYDKTHKAEKSAREAFRRAQKINATPKWLTEDHKKQIESIYKERNRLQQVTGIIYHVDHIIPLIHSDLCGLHVPWNLQIIPATDNLKKSNKV